MNLWFGLVSELSETHKAQSTQTEYADTRFSVHTVARRHDRRGDRRDTVQRQKEKTSGSNGTQHIALHTLVYGRIISFRLRSSTHKENEK